MNSPRRPGTENPELEALFQAMRQVESSLVRERGLSARMGVELQALRDRHAQEINQARGHLQQLLQRDQELRRRLKTEQDKTRAWADYSNKLKEQNARLAADAKDNAKRVELDLVAARTAYEHLKRRAHELEDSIARMRPEMERARQDLERAQAEVLERDHRYQATMLGYQAREQNQQTTIRALEDQVKQLKEELSRAKSRWIDTERMRQDSERARVEAEVAARGKSPSNEKLRKLEEANQFLQERLAEEKRRRKEAEASASTANLNSRSSERQAGHREMDHQEMDRIRSELRKAEDRLAYTEAQLSKVSAEASLLRATTRQDRGFDVDPAVPGIAGVRTEGPRPVINASRAVNRELLEKLALLGYPVQD